METGAALTPGEVLAHISAALDQADHQLGTATDGALIATVGDALVLAGRVHAYALSLLAEIENRDAVHHEVGVSTAGWLADTQRYTRRESNQLIRDASDLRRFTQVRDGMLAGSISIPQSQAVARVLHKLPDDLGIDSEHAAETTMVEYCAEFDSHALNNLARHLIDVIAPEIAEEAEAKRLEREARQARTRRHLSFAPDGDGSMLIRGSLPIIEGELLKAQVDAIAAQARRVALDMADPLTEPGTTTTTMRRADALLQLIDQAARARIAPSNGGDRPRIIVTIDYERLTSDCSRGGILPTGTELPAGELRRLACEAHHLIPWQNGGLTSLDNLVSLCRLHHGIIEPGERPEHTRWHIRLRDDGVPEVIPPRHVDRSRRPRIHQRFRLPDSAA